MPRCVDPEAGVLRVCSAAAVVRKAEPGVGSRRGALRSGVWLGVLLGLFAACLGPPRRTRTSPVVARPVRVDAERVVASTFDLLATFDLSTLSPSASVVFQSDQEATTQLASVAGLAFTLLYGDDGAALLAWDPRSDARTTTLPLGSLRLSASLADSAPHLIISAREPAGALQVRRLDPLNPISDAITLTATTAPAGESGGTVGSSCAAGRCVHLVHEPGADHLTCIVTMTTPRLAELGRAVHRLAGVAPDLRALALSARGDEVAVVLLRSEPAADQGAVDVWLLDMACQRLAQLTVAQVTVGDAATRFDQRQVDIAYLGDQIHVLWADDDLLHRRLQRDAGGLSALAVAQRIDLNEGASRLSTVGFLPLPDRAEWLLTASGVSAWGTAQTTLARLQVDADGGIHLLQSSNWLLLGVVP